MTPYLNSLTPTCGAIEAYVRVYNCKSLQLAAVDMYAFHKRSELYCGL